jgi:hypothetical protein
MSSRTARAVQVPDRRVDGVRGDRSLAELHLGATSHQMPLTVRSQYLTDCGPAHPETRAWLSA